MPNNAQMKQSEMIAALQDRLNDLEAKTGAVALPKLSILKCQIVTKGMHKQLFHRLAQHLGFEKDETEGAEIPVRYWIGIPGDPMSQLNEQRAILKKDDDGKLRWFSKAPPEQVRPRGIEGNIAMAGIMSALMLCFLAASAFGQAISGPVVPAEDVSITNMTVNTLLTSQAVVVASAGTNGAVGPVYTTNGFNNITAAVAPQTPYTVSRILAYSATAGNSLFYGPACIFSNAPTVTFTNVQFGTSIVQTNTPANGVIAATQGQWSNYDPWVIAPNTTTNLGPLGCALYGFITNGTASATGTITVEDIKVGK